MRPVHSWEVAPVAVWCEEAEEEKDEEKESGFQMLCIFFLSWSVRTALRALLLYRQQKSIDNLESRPLLLF